jgi:hypothetical protein
MRKSKKRDNRRINGRFHALHFLMEKRSASLHVRKRAKSDNLDRSELNKHHKKLTKKDLQRM